MASSQVFDNTGLTQDWKTFLAATEQTTENPRSVNVTPGDPSTAAAGASPPPNLSVQSPHFWGLTFNTGENKSRYNDPKYDIDGSILLGLSATLPVGLDLRVGSVLTQFGITAELRKNNGLVTDILTLLGDSLSLSLTSNPKEQRCGMWLSPGMTFRSDTALCFTPNSTAGILDSITQTVHSHFNFTNLPHIDLVIYLQRTCFGVQVSGGNDALEWRVTNTYRLTFKLTIRGLIFWLSLTPTGVSCALTQDSEGDFWNKLTNLGADNPSSSSMPVLTDILSAITPLKISIGKQLNGGNWWQVVAVMKWNRPDPQDVRNKKESMQLYLTYNSLSSTLAGGLVVTGFYATDTDKKLKTYEIGSQLDAPTLERIPDFWDIKQLSKDLDTLPNGLPTAIAFASISYQNQTLFFSAKLVNPPSVSSSVPFPITWDELDVQITKGAGSAFSFSATTLFTLHPRPGPDELKYSAATLGVSVSYSASKWELSCHVENLQFGILAGYFREDFREPMLAVLGKLAIKSLDVDYTFDDSAVASSFFMRGDILVGGLELKYGKTPDPVYAR
jgi:hypothetical protein